MRVRLFVLCFLILFPISLMGQLSDSIDVFNYPVSSPVSVVPYDKGSKWDWTEDFINLLRKEYPLIIRTSLISRRNLAVEYKVSDGWYIAWITCRRSFLMKTIRLCRTSDLDSIPLDHTLYSGENCRKVYDLIVRPLEKYMRRGAKVYYAPAGKINFINIEALADASGRRCFELYHFYRVTHIYDFPEDTKGSIEKAYLFGSMKYDTSFERMQINNWWAHCPGTHQYYTDFTGPDLSDVSFGHAEDGTRAGFADLKFSRDEVRELYRLARILGGTVNTGNKAVEEVFKLHANSCGSSQRYLMHVSTHSFTVDLSSSPYYNSLTPKEAAYSSCGLLFSGAAHTLKGESVPWLMNDGLLYAQEIASLDMRYCDFLVLSACNTALGSVTQDGVLGLQSAFREAGVKTMMMTLWSVNDKATAEFMKCFYKYLFSGKTKHRALELARGEMSKSKDFSDPYYWAPFILQD